MKKVVVAGLVILLCIGFSTFSWGGERVVRLLYSHEPYLKALQEIIPEFEKKFGVKVEITANTYEEHYEKLKIEIATQSSTYDVISYDAMVFATYIGLQYWADLDELQQKYGIDLHEETVVPGHIENIDRIVDGTLYSFPLYFDTGYHVVLRKDLIEDPNEQAKFQAKYGYKLGPPKTWDQYHDLAEFFTRDRDGDGKIDFWGDVQALEIGPAFDQWNSRYITFRFPEEASEKYQWMLTDNYKPIFNGPQGVKALEYVVDIYKNGYTVPGALGMWWGNMHEPIAQDRAFMTHMFIDLFPPLEDPEISKVVGKMGYYLGPHVEEPTYLFGGWVQSINKYSKNKKDALQWIAWSMNEENDLKTALMKWRYPIRKTSYETPKLIEECPWNEPSYKGLFAGRLLTYPQIAEFEEMIYEVTMAVQRACRGEVTPKQALDDAAKRVTEILRVAGYYGG